MSMKIVIITSCSFPASEGLGTHVKSISEHFALCGNTVEVYIRMPGKGNVERVSVNDVNYILIPSTSIPVVSSFIFRKKCEEILKKIMHTVDVIHYHTPLVLPLNFDKKINTITTVHSTMKEDTKHIEIINVKSILYKIMGRFISPFFENALFKESSQVIAVSPGVHEELSSLYNIPMGNVSTIINGIDLDVFSPKCNVCDKEKIIIFVGRIGFRKGIPELIEAIHKLREKLNGYKFRIIGTGDLDYYLEEKINKYSLGDIIDWRKHVPQEKLPKLLSSSKFLIMPSSYETGPRVVLESIACLTPIISTRVGLVEKIERSAYIEISNSSVDSIQESILFSVGLTNKSYNSYVDSLKLERDKFDRKLSCEELLTKYES